ncbi:MAG: hypothetical protein ACRC2H_04075 [Silanimonas sp.]
MIQRHALAALAAALLLCACTAAMTTSEARSPRYPGAPNIDREYTGTVADWPLFFIRHHYASDCFDTQYCRIAYGNYVSEDATPQRSIASYGKDYPSILTNSVSIGIENFAGPVEIDWKSKDGTPLKASLDFDEIFKDRLVPIPPGVEREEIPDLIGIGPTTIIVEVNDRTVSIYTTTDIPMKEAQIPGNRFSFHNNDLVRVFTRTY